MTAPVTDPVLDQELLARYAELTRRAEGLRRGGRLGGPTLLLVIGAVTVSLGLLLVVLGWLGASHTIYVFEQVPYLISGGLLGGSLVVAGSATYFAYWMTKVHGQNQRAADSLERMEELLRVLVEQGSKR